MSDFLSAAERLAIATRTFPDYGTSPIEPRPPRVIQPGTEQFAIATRTFPAYGPYPPPPIPAIGYPYGSGNYGAGLYGYGEENP
ncbi:MAG: hypothetical protein M3440_13375 [Chloroflexota bacterium]|nr:hypothetical protein [Chloroflexota bacterium]